MIKTPNFDKQAIVSYSGGMDSTCLILHLLSKGYRIRAISFNYGQNHDVELKRAKANIKYLGKLGLPVTFEVINLQDVFSGDCSTLVKHTSAPFGDYREDIMKETVVCNRNVIFSAVIFAKALNWAKNTGLDTAIALGAHKGDHAIYPDCTEESTSLARELYRISNWDSEKVNYLTPFINNHKGEVLRHGLDAMKQMGFTKSQINKVLKNTISCYNATSDGRSCGKCGTCRERLEAFEFCGIKDPITYICE
jgi:7-cyano-7-deazaguanine synthase